MPGMSSYTVTRTVRLLTRCAAASHGAGLVATFTAIAVTPCMHARHVAHVHHMTCCYHLHAMHTDVRWLGQGQTYLGARHVPLLEGLWVQ
jgi:hypothetical protein